MRESRTYGSVRGARDEIRVPTATEATAVHYAARQRRGGVAAASEGGAGDACNPGEANQLTEAATLGLGASRGGAR